MHTGDAAAKIRKGKFKEGESIADPDQEREASDKKRLATLDIFAGCGGLSEGLQQSGNNKYIVIARSIIISTVNA